MKKIFNFFIVAILFLGCQKNNVSNDLTTNNQKEEINALITKAKSTLKAALPSDDFTSLDWENIQTKNLNIKNPILKLSSTAEKNKFLYYSNTKNEEIYNWVTYNLTTTNKQVSGVISVNDVSNKLLREINLVNNKVVSLYNAINSPTVSTVVTMDEVIVTGYLNQQGFNYLSYWWLFSNSSYGGLYESLENYESGGGGGSGVYEPVTIVTIDSVVNNLTDTCLKAAFNMITATNLTNQLSKLYQQTFVGVAKTHNLKIIQLDHVYVNGIEVPAASHVASGDASTWVIEMSGSLDNYPLEIYAGFISHEMIHGFIQMNNLDFNVSSVVGNAHYEMLDKWILQTKSLLEDAFGIPSNDALALSLNGYDDLLNNETNPSFTQAVRDWMNFKYGLNITAAEQITDQYLNKLKGTICH